MTKKEIENRLKDMALPLISQMGLIYVDSEYVNENGEYYLRLFVDKVGGLTIDDCVALTHPMNELLDKEDYIEEAYIFEVSSPGIDRPLSTQGDFIRSLDKEIDVKLYVPIDGLKEYTGILKEYDDNTIAIVVDNSDIIKIDRKKIAQIKQTIRF